MRFIVTSSKALVIAALAAQLVQAQADTVAPTVTFAEGLTDGRVAKGEVALGFTAADNVGVRPPTLTINGIEFPLTTLTVEEGGATPQAGLTRVRATVLWNSTSLPDGEYQVVASVKDGAGNTGMAQFRISVRNAPPVAQPVWKHAEDQAVDRRAAKGSGSLRLAAVPLDSSGNPDARFWIHMRSYQVRSDAPTSVQLVAGKGDWCGTERELLSQRFAIDTRELTFPDRPVPAGKHLCVVMTSPTATIAGDLVFHVDTVNP